jgi:hypothetical protein
MDSLSRPTSPQIILPLVTLQKKPSVRSRKQRKDITKAK